ncbi:MAG: hypothetical protein JWO67_5014 [Streptosporangiaceae bacterium]|nr:hypothetical protein [Streptosporangiaceae bacterium]
MSMNLHPGERPRAATVAGAALIAALVVTGLASCGSRAMPAGACAPPVAVEGARLTALPLDLSGAGTVTEVRSGAGRIGATAVTESTVDESYARVRGMLGKGGFKITAGESEGSEAEVYFSRGKETAGSVKFVQGPCEGQATMKLNATSTAVR